MTNTDTGELPEREALHACRDRYRNDLGDPLAFSSAQSRLDVGIEPAAAVSTEERVSVTCRIRSYPRRNSVILRSHR